MTSSISAQIVHWHSPSEVLGAGQTVSEETLFAVEGLKECIGNQTCP